MNRRSGGQEARSLVETIRLHWRRLLPMWLVSPAFFVLTVVVLQKLPDTMALIIFSVVLLPFFFWSFFRAWGLVMTGELSQTHGFLLIMAPFLPLAVVTLYLLQLVGAR